MTWMRHKVNSKRNKAGLNLEFFFSRTGGQTKTKETSFPYYLPMAPADEMDLYLSM